MGTMGDGWWQLDGARGSRHQDAALRVVSHAAPRLVSYHRLYHNVVLPHPKPSRLLGPLLSQLLPRSPPRSRFPGAPVFAVGYSLGGLKLTKYLGEADAGLHVPPPGAPRLFAGSGLDAAAVVSSPVSLWHSSANLADTSSLNFMYNLAVAYK